jgi:hypothetical protein
MNKNLNISIVLNVIVIVACLFVLLRFEQVRTPELFGDATMVTLRGLGGGVIVNDSYVFMFREHMSDAISTGEMTQILGKKIEDVDGSIPYLRHYNKANTKFTGWIDFRGHERAFCGYKDEQGYTMPCRWSP